MSITESDWPSREIDGVTIMARKNAIVSVQSDFDMSVNSGLVSFVVDGLEPINLTVGDLPDAVTSRALFHGIIQKVSDAAALGKDATPADKHAAMQSVVDRLVSGDWNKRSGDGSDSAPAGIIFRAFYQFAMDRAAKAKKPVPAEEAVRALYDSKTRSEQLAIRNIPEVKAIMETMRTAKASSVDVDSLLAELG
jgi:hypothetical protein